MKALLRQFVARYVSDAALRRSTQAFFWGVLIAGFLEFSGDVLLVGGLFPYSGSPPTSAMFAVKFVAWLIGSTVAGCLAPARPARHALAPGVVVYLASLLGIVCYWSTYSPWYYINQGLVVLLAAILAGWLVNLVRRLLRYRGS